MSEAHSRESRDSTVEKGRRSFMTGGVAGATLLWAGISRAARGEGAQATTQSEEPSPDSADTKDATYLFIQTAASAVLEDGVLTLEGVSPVTVYFTDRPERLAGHFETDHFVEAMKEDSDRDSFGEDPPNATLSVFDGDHVTDIVVELDEPTVKGTTIIYPVKILDGPEAVRGGPVALFIDPIGRPLSPGSVAGVHRRHRRRRHAAHHW